MIQATGFVLLLSLGGGKNHREVLPSRLDRHRLLVRQTYFQLDHTLILLTHSVKGIYEDQRPRILTGVLVRVDVIEIVRLLTELHLGIAIPELLHQESVVLLYNLPDKRAGDGGHFDCT